MSNRVVIRNGKPGFIINGKFVPIPDSDNVNTTSPRIPRDDMSGLEAIGSVIKNTVTGKGAAGIKQDSTKPNPNYVGPGGGRPPVNQNPDEYFGTGDYGSGGPKEKPKQKFPDLRGGDDKVDGYGNPKVDYTKPQIQSIPVDPAPPTTTPPTAPTPAKTYKVPGYGDMTKDEIKKKYDALRYSDKPKERANAPEFGNAANKAVFPNQRVTRRMQQQTPGNAATGGVNPRAGSYAMMQKANMDNLTSNYGASPVGTIKPVAKRTMKQEAYDLVLDYLLSEGHVDTVEEAHYVMLQMTSEHVQQVVEERTAADPGMRGRMGRSNPAINGKPIPNPPGHPDAGKPMSYTGSETSDANEYREASQKAGRKIRADEPLPKK